MAQDTSENQVMTRNSHLPIRQIAYFVSDVRAAAIAHHALYGSGPFFLAEHIPLRRTMYRGIESPLDHSSAYGQWGTLMIEFVQQNNPDDSAFHELYPRGSGRSGLHHVALFVDDLPAAIARHNQAGFATALYGEMNDGLAFAMIDQVNETGHMLELYEPRANLLSFYAMVASAADDFGGGADLIRPIVFR